MEKLKTISGKILGFWQETANKAWFLALVAFLISIIPTDYNIVLMIFIKIFTILVPSILYTLKEKGIAKFKFVMSFIGIYLILYVLKLSIIVISANTGEGNVFPFIIVFLLAALRILLFVIYELIFMLLGFYIVNSLGTQLIRLFEKNPFCSKITEFFEFLLLKAPQYLILGLILAASIYNISNYILLGKGNFSAIKFAGTSPIVYSLNDKDAIILNSSFDSYMLLDITKNKINQTGKVGFFENHRQDINSAQLDDSNILITAKSPDSINEKSGTNITYVDYSIFNTDLLQITKTGQFEFPSYILDCITLAPNKVVIVLRGGSLYLYNNGKLSELKGTTSNFIYAKLIKIDENNFYIVGFTDVEYYNQTKRIIEKFDVKNNKPEIVYFEVLPKELDIKLDKGYLLSDGKILLLNTYNDGYRKLIYTLIGSDYRKIIEKDLDYKDVYPISEVAATLYKNDSIFISSGFAGNFRRGHYNRKAYIYHIDSDKLIRVKNKLKVDRLRGEAFELPNNKVIIINGYNNNFSTDKFEIYNP